MDIVTGALGSVLSKLAEFLKDEYNLQAGVREKIMSLSRELESMHAALRKVAGVPPNELDELPKLWARDVRELSYTVEDILDTFLVRVEAGRKRKDPDMKWYQHAANKILEVFSQAKARRDISSMIDVISEKAKEVAMRRERYSLDHIMAEPSAKNTVDPRFKLMYREVTQLVGIDKSRGELLSMLDCDDVSNKNIVRMVSIVGVGGLGKTTLAKASYDEMKSSYDCSAFVSVGQNPDILKVFMDILYYLDKTKHENIHTTGRAVGLLISELQEFLKNKRYLIIIDDIWDIEPWEMIRCALPENGLKSRIITTTRINDVAEHVGSCYKLNPLPHKSSKILFYGRIFGSEENCPKQFFNVSEKILKKCGGIPLAIVTTSSLLANKSNINEWHDVCDSIGSGLGSNPGMDSMRKILLLSYYDLTPQLKTCLLYLSIFPEDYEITKFRLIFRWIAEGFIQQGDVRQSLFEIGNSYFIELLNRSLIQPGHTDQDDMSPLSCRVHDMVLDIIYSLSREECFCTTVSSDYKQSTSSECKVRRLSIHNTSWTPMNMSKLRSLTVCKDAIINSMPSLSCYHLLRVLDLLDCNLSGYPSIEFVSKLVHLRYLSLADTGYNGEVLSEIGKLQFLQTLSFPRTGIKELPSSALELRQLICLETGRSTRLPNGLRNLLSLEFLVLNVDSADIAKELGHLTQLKVLRVMLEEDKEGRWDESMCKVLVGSLAKLHKIQAVKVLSVDVEFDLDGSVDSLQNLSHLVIKGTRWLPTTWINPASCVLLSTLNLEVGQLRSEDIRVIGMLPALRHLIVGVTGIKQVFERHVVTTDAFPCVTRCTFYGFSMVPSMFPPGAMPMLQRFEFDIRQEDFAGSEFNDVDDLALSHLPSLQSVRVHLDGEERVSKEVAMQVKEALRKEACAHCNHPDIHIRIDYQWIQL